MLHMFLKTLTQNRFYNLISSINSIKEEPFSSKANIKRPPLCKVQSNIFQGTSELKENLLSNERKSDISCTVVSKVP